MDYTKQRKVGKTEFHLLKNDTNGILIYYFKKSVLQLIMIGKSD